ncbi:MAG TPA: transcription elongation factor GreA [Pseudolabrys sp.]|nr:transcription elongation factor GreA [Pseudolabrys sp.]
MSRAFVKETDAETPVPPERPVSLHPNFVTAEGLPAIEAELARLDKAHAAAVRAEDREAIALTQRDQRYWTARRASAQVVGAPPADGYVHFGSVVTLTRVDGRRQTFRIVGEDEADPARGTVSYVSPLARALTGRGVGDRVSLGGDEAEILSIA